MLKHYCHRKGCSRIRSEWSLFLSRRRPPLFEGNTFCGESCLREYFEEDLTNRWHRLQRQRARGISRPRLGAILLQTGSVTSNQLDEAVSLQRQAGEGRLGEWLQRLGFVEERQITAALSKQYGIPWINLKNIEVKPDAVKAIPGIVARCSNLLPVGYDDIQNSLRIAVSGPVDFTPQEAIRRMLRKGVLTYIADLSVIQDLLEQWYEPEELDLSSAPTFHSLEELLEIAASIVESAIEERAEDVRTELLEDYLWVRQQFGKQSRHKVYRYAPNQLPISAGGVAAASANSYLNL